MDQVEKLKEHLRNGAVIPVIGAGVSYATAGLPGWKGLIEDGLNYAETRRANANIIAEARQLLAKNKLTEAATTVKELLNAPGHPFTNWLNDCLGRPRIKSSALIESVQNLCQPIIATTNYDDLLRSVGSVQTDLALDWSQHEEVQSCLDNHKQFIFHLHGIFTRPHTPIFGADDYNLLKQQIGYKTILSQLWMQRAFLFIGCSRDGVMDEDFSTVLNLMRDWFPSSPREHYILMLESEIGSATHWELMRDCNVHIIPFGKTHDDLPQFINSINPNALEIVRRFERRKTEAYNGIKAILESQPEGKLPETIGKFISNNLGRPYYWVDNDRLKIFEAAVLEYNIRIDNKQQKLHNQQVITRSLVDISDLQNKIDLWMENSRETSKINTHEYINMGILAYKCLTNFPQDILHDIRLRDFNVIHHAYFAGNLKGFYNEALRWKENSGSLQDFDGDHYFFENLRRIMDSLKGVLSLDAKDIYPEKVPAKITKQIPNPCLLFVAAKLLTIREAEAPYNTLAELPWEEGLEFRNAWLILVKDQLHVIGFNAQYCFKWNPSEELTLSNFFSVDNKNEIIDLKIVLDGQDVVLDIYTTKSRVTMANFSESLETAIERRFGNYVRLKSHSRTFCTHRVSTGMRGNCVFELDTLGNYSPKMSTIDLWSQIKDIEPIRLSLEQHLVDTCQTFSEQEYEYPYIVDVTLAQVKWIEKDALAVRCRISLSGPDSTAVLIIDPDLGFDCPVSKIIFPNKNCFSFDTIATNHVDFVAGYLDFNIVGNLIQYFEKIDSKRIIVAGSQPGIMPQNLLIRNKVRDMFQVLFAKTDRAFIIEEGKILHDVKIPYLSDIETEIEGGIDNIRYHEIR